MRLGLRFLGLISGVAWLAACSAEGTMADTDGETDTDTDTDSDGTMGVTMSSTTVSPTTTAGNTMSGTSNPTSTTLTTTTDDTSGTTMVDPSATTMVEEETGCPPGTEGCPCDVGSTCEGDLMCVDGTCEGAAACDQPDEEPNDSFEEAIDLGAVMCSMEYATADGALDGLDADFYTLTEAEGGFCFDPDPQVVVTADQDVRVCIYMACDDGTGDLACGNDQDDDTFDDLNGCCATNEARLFGANCGVVFPPDPVFFVRVSSADEEACVAYEMSYRVE